MVWNEPRSGWRNAVALLQPPAESGRAGKDAHQYLTQPGQSPLVEAAVMEEDAGAARRDGRLYGLSNDVIFLGEQS